MGYGFSAQNNTGKIVIDQNYFNPHLFQEGSFTSGFKRIAFAANRADIPLVAVSTGIGGRPVFYMNTYMNTAETAYKGVDLLASGTGTTNYAFYDAVGGITSNTNWGMQVFDGSSNVVFDSRRAYLKVVDVVTLNGTDYGHTYTHASVNPAWYVINSLTGLQFTFQVFSPGPPPLGLSLARGRFINQASSTSVTVSMGPTNNAGVGPDLWLGLAPTIPYTSKLLVCEKIPI